MASGETVFFARPPTSAAVKIVAPTAKAQEPVGNNVKNSPRKGPWFIGSGYSVPIDMMNLFGFNRYDSTTMQEHIDLWVRLSHSVDRSLSD